MQDVLSEPCKSWPTRWDEYVAAACWIKRTMPDPLLPSAITPFPVPLRSSRRTTLDMLVPQMDDTEATSGLSNLIENRRHNTREVAEALKKLHEDKEVARQRRNAGISWPSAGVNVAEGDLVLALESDSALFRQGMGSKLVHEKWIDPWTVIKVVFKGLSEVREMEGRKKRSRTVLVASLRPFYRRSSDLRHPKGDEFAQIAWGADSGLKGDSVAAAPMCTLIDRKVESDVGTVRWEYWGRYLDGVSSDWVKEAEALDSFIPLQLETFHALRNLIPRARHAKSGLFRGAATRGCCLKRGLPGRRTCEAKTGSMLST